MTRSLCVLILLLLSPALHGGEKINSLTPQEIRDGWLLLFDGDSTFGWQIDGEATVEKGVLVLGGKKATQATFKSRFDSFDLRLACRSEGNEQAKLVLKRVGGEVIEDFGKAAKNDQVWDWLSFQAEFDKGSSTQKTSYSYGGHDGGVYFGGGKMSGLQGAVSIGFKVPASSRLLLRNVKLRPLGTKSIFNGKDLTGWKVFANKKSIFTVTPQGELNVKNGPGDLQTEAKWANFVLQFECLSNGKHLNSGLFFRCIPGQYQNGYEAQIRNEFKPEPSQAYTVEEYDPRTHQLVGKKKVMSPAVDFGTGAIYRRVPARKQASKDGEWFTMTIVARGRHLATWVNGVQMVDWIDNRALHENPRNGCRLEAGPISLQGHDPTTDLSFRNFRIAELPQEKKARE
jgi:hypothetical protein